MTGPDAILVQCAGPAAAELHTAVTALAGQCGAAHARVYAALEGGEIYAYLDAPAVSFGANDAFMAFAESARALLPGRSAVVSRLILMIDLKGASHGEAAPCHYVVEADAAEGTAGDMDAWYADEHLPGLASVPGTVRATRYRNLDNGPGYLACYDLTTHDTLGTPAWLAVRATPWSSRVRPNFRNTRRTLFRRIPAD